jgi:uncharacterized protein (TIGR00251 family)
VIKLTEGPDGVGLTVKARPSARRDAILGEHAGALKVSVTAAPEKGKANESIVALLAEKLEVRKRDIRLVRGAHSSEKAFLINGIEPERLAERLRAILESGDD